MQEGGAMFEEPITLGSIENISPEALVALSSSRIFFGHQSVGDNIVEGIKAIAGEKRHFN